MLQMEMFSNIKSKQENKIIHNTQQTKSPPKISFEALLSDKFIEQNGLYCLRGLIRNARYKKNWSAFLQSINAEIEIKKGKNTIKNNIIYTYMKQNT